MLIEKCNLSDVIVLEPNIFQDNRGFFSEVYNKQILHNVGIETNFVQDNHSMSKLTGTFRGFHFQLPPYEQAKLVRVIRGSILDVVIDIRTNSSTFGDHYSVLLSSENRKQIFVPTGFAHGFLTLEDNTEVLYKTSNYYTPDSEGGINYNDRKLKISWPINEKKFILTQRDKSWPDLSELEKIF